MRRHVIVEGMDGSGKDTLIASLQKLFSGHTLHDRASTSLGGPVPDLASWVVNDTNLMPALVPSIYNRHPLVSEPIYAPVREVNKGLTGVWTNQAWLTAMRREVSKHAVLVVCHPSYYVVSDNLIRSGRDAHMPGVMENRLHLYTEYATMVWPGPSIRYNYMTDTPDTLAELIRRAHDWQEN